MEVGSQWSLSEVHEALELHKEQKLVLAGGRKVECVGDLTPGEDVWVLGAGGSYWPSVDPPRDPPAGVNFIASPLDNLTAPTERIPWRARGGVAATQPSKPSYGAYEWPNEWQQHWKRTAGRMPNPSAELAASWIQGFSRTMMEHTHPPAADFPARASRSRIRQLATPNTWVPRLKKVWVRVSVSEPRVRCGRAEWSMERERDCLLYTSDAADEEDSVDLGGRRIIKKKKK
eukprot:TRINITY_DN56804_c0_g1_i1.p1 TRINITY_DN56804_c0_g1~~TRINITY_DN56804_c0_g1_i1.p1  ORF type:complete len:231 (-),score=54.28 TRINITY_DN56804_c0_g1_i1:115-807(-)